MNKVSSEKNISYIFDYANWYIRNRVSGINAFIAINGDQIIAEHYYNGHNEHTRSHVTSITKSVISLLTGIALEKGFICNIDLPIKDFFKIKMDRSICEITIKELLTMCSGIAYPYSGFNKEQNWIDFILGLKVDRSKRGYFQYADGNAHLLSGIISNSTGLSTYEFASKYLFSKIGAENIEQQNWLQDPQGINIGGWGLNLTAKEMASIGIVLLNNGFYKNNKIVSDDWIKESTTVKIKCNDSFNLEKGYGYYWWVGEEKGYRIYFARGVWEQYIIIVPALNMIFIFKGEERAKTKSNIGLFWRNHIFRKLLG
jgi:CubicO group peptidase (beta-lactamase class C family)